MYGLIIRMKKLKNETETSNMSNNPHYAPLLGHYDQFDIRVTKVMPDFYFSLPNEDLRKIEKYGESQVVYLYNYKRIPSENDPFEDTLNSHYDKKNKPDTYKAGQNNAAQYNLMKERTCKVNERKKFLPKYVMLSLLTLGECCESYFSLEKPREFLFRQIEDKLNQLIKLSPEIEGKLDYSLFASLGTGDVGILWFTDKLHLPMMHLKDLKRLTFSPVKDFGKTDLYDPAEREIFFNSYSVVALTSKDQDGFLCEGSDCPEVDISITFDGNHAPEKMIEESYEMLFNKKISSEERKEFEKKYVLFRYGKNDIALRVSASLVPMSFFTYETSKKSFYQPHSRLFFPSCIFEYKNCSNFDYTINVKCDDAEGYREFFRKNADEAYPEKQTSDNKFANSIKANVENTITLMEKYELFTRVAHLKGAFTQLLNELIRINPNTCSQWMLDLCSQYKGCIDAISCIAKKTSSDSEPRAEGNRKFYEDITKIINALLQTFRHVAQSSRMYFDAPGSGLPYAGSLRRVIWAYYGIVKLFIENIYAIRRKSFQRKLLPLIVFSEMPTVEIRAFDMDDVGESSLLLITLPYASLYNLPKYIRYLAHELHHYAAPPDRYIRNRIFGTFILSRLLSYAFTKTIANETSEHESEKVKRSNVIHKFVREEYDAILAKCRIANIQPDSEWKDFFSQLDKVFASPKKDDVGLTDLIGIFRLFGKYIHRNSEENAAFLQNTVIHKFFDTDQDLAAPLCDVFKDDDEWKELAPHIEGAIEACCDYYMIQMTMLNKNSDLDLYSYLDFVSDYLYAHGVQPDTLVQPKSLYAMRLGLILHLYCSEKENKNVNDNEFGLFLSGLSTNWKKHNERITNDRKEYHRDTKKTKYREKMADILFRFAQQYKDGWGSIFHDMKLLHSGNLERIFKNFFYLPQREMVYYAKKQDDYFRGLVGRLHRFCKAYNKIQEIKDKLKRCKECFDLHMEMIEDFNRQKKLSELDDIWEKSEKKSTDKELKVAPATKDYHGCANPQPPEKRKIPIQWDWDWDAYSLNDFISRYKAIHQMLEREKEAHFFWHRGLTNASHTLIPFLYRKIKEKNKEDKIRQNMSTVQQTYFDHFLARVTPTNALGGASALSTIDWLGVMQHYRVPTHLLDWSENLLVAMYFMLEPFILIHYEKDDTEIQKRIEKSLDKGAALYVFDPIAYNKLWQKNKEKNTLPKCILKHKMNMPDLSPLPNLSLKSTADLFGAYVLGEQNTCPQRHNLANACKYCSLQYPIAIQTAQSNLRLRAQSGTFLAFSLRRTGTIEDAALEEVQRKWLVEYQDEDKPMLPFLYKITVKTKKTIEELADWIRAAGMDTFRVYSDLEYIGKFVKNKS